MDGRGEGSQCAGLPVREISSETDLEQFLGSETCAKYLAFVERLGAAVAGQRVREPCAQDCPQSVRWALALLDEMHALVSTHPPASTTSRFGNPAFRGWLDAVCLLVPAEHRKVLGAPADEVASYLLNALGDRQRIDYGTGHEAHFAAWLLCLSSPETGPFFREADDKLLVLSLFARYVSLMRTLQRTYWLEPAGSHGVWGLDDYHFLPFLWGAAQLVGTLRLRCGCGRAGRI